MNTLGIILVIIGTTALSIFFYNTIKKKNIKYGFGAFGVLFLLWGFLVSIEADEKDAKQNATQRIYAPSKRDNKPILLTIPTKKQALIDTAITIKNNGEVDTIYLYNFTELEKN